MSVNEELQPVENLIKNASLVLRHYRRSSTLKMAPVCSLPKRPYLATKLHSVTNYRVSPFSLVLFS
jgi:hypothetical protein